MKTDIKALIGEPVAWAYSTGVLSKHGHKDVVFSVSMKQQGDFDLGLYSSKQIQPLIQRLAEAERERDVATREQERKIGVLNEKAALYDEALLQVTNKVEGQTRHETMIALLQARNSEMWAVEQGE